VLSIAPTPLEDVPVVISRYDRVLKKTQPRGNRRLPRLNVAIERDRVRDVVVVWRRARGAGRRGLWRFEGLDVLVVESHAPGGQSWLELQDRKLPRFPTGISGQALAARAFMQAEKFGADILIARSGTRLRATAAVPARPRGRDHRVDAHDRDRDGCSVLPEDHRAHLPRFEEWASTPARAARRRSFARVKT